MNKGMFGEQSISIHMIPKIPEEHQMQAIITLLTDIHTNTNLQNEILIDLLAASRNVDKKEIEALLNDRREVIGLELATWMVQNLT